jgi:hypothetical protein
MGSLKTKPRHMQIPLLGADIRDNTKWGKILFLHYFTEYIEIAFIFLFPRNLDIG